MNVIFLGKNINKRQIHKFGGSSLSDAKCYIMVAGIIAEYSKQGDIIVISAAGKTTNQLIYWWNVNNKKKIKNIIHNYNMNIMEYILLPSEISILIMHLFIKDINNLSLLIKNKKNIPYAEFIGKGEIWSARLMTAILKNLDMQIFCIDSSYLLYLKSITTPKKVNEKISYPLLNSLLKKNFGKRLFVFPGFISRNELGSIVLLGRNGSDYSATQIGFLSDSKYVNIWSDVSGIYSSDPKIIKKYFSIRILNFYEANEISRLSVPILHNRTLQPIYKKKITLLLRCSYNNEKGFTRIENTVAYWRGTKVLTSHDTVLLMELFGSDHKSFQYKKKIFTFIDNSNIPPLSIKIYIKNNCIKCCYIKEVLINIFRFLYKYSLPAKFHVIKSMQLVAIIGFGVSKNLLQCYRFYKKLKNKFVYFIDHEEEGISLIAVLIKENIKYIVNSMHKIIFMENKTIGIVLFGKGNIGSSWLDIFNFEQNILYNRSSVYFILAGVVDSRRCLFNFKKGLNLVNVLTVFEKKSKFLEKDYLLKCMQYHTFDDLIVIDVTASEKLSEKYIYFAKYGFHVISANKFAGAVAIWNYRMIQDTFTKSNRYWLSNATVGAGIPVNYIIRDLRESGDSILEISGIFSGTLSWLFNKFHGILSFTNLVEQAWQKGFTEPDPRLDISGEDVLRKLIILSRESGFPIEKTQVHIESIVPIDLQKCSIINFFKNSEKINNNIIHRFQYANNIGYVLRHIAKFHANSREANVGVESVELNHPIASILPSDNIFIIESVWYKKNPLVIRGPGAGREVTACAVQSDINYLSKLL